jgi:steroid 5-alpha reductase family enzyme
MDKVFTRKFSFILVSFIYIFATAVGVISYFLFNTPFYLSLLFADIIATIVTFIFSVIFKNASVYDPYWSVQPIVIIVAFIIGYGFSLSVLFPLIAILIWGTRLTANWAYTFKGLTHQDWRYTMLNETTGKFYPIINFIGIHMVPTLIVYGTTLPAVFIAVYKPNFNAYSLFFFALSILAALLQGTADVEMHKFRKNPDGKFIRRGLWKYSRHPNYLGEIAMWWGIGGYAVVLMPNVWYLLVGALLNTVLFLVVSIPMADKRQSKKEGFSEYKKQTRMLFPIKK